MYQESISQKAGSPQVLCGVKPDQAVWWTVAKKAWAVVRQHRIHLRYAMIARQSTVDATGQAKKAIPSCMSGIQTQTTRHSIRASVSISLFAKTACYGQWSRSGLQ